MGQDFIATLLDHAGRITRAVHPLEYGAGGRLNAHTRDGSTFLTAVQCLLALDGGSRLVWAGDYAPNEPGHDANLYWLIEPHQFVRFAGLIDPDAHVEPNAPHPAVPLDSHTYVCNTDRREYFDKLTMPIDHHGQPRNMLPTLTAHGDGEPGRWARDRIYIAATHPGRIWTAVPGPSWP